jgi:hypothetical protein
MACGGDALPKDDKGREDFFAFQQKFYSDSLFQLQRIEFPLAGTDPKGLDDEFYWDVDNWVQLRPVEASESIRILPVVDMETWMRERMIVQDRFYMEKQFTLIDGQWYLTSYSGMSTIN